MLRINDIVTGLEHLVGWEQGIIPAEQIAEDLTESESGLYYQSAHPMVTLKNLQSVMPEFDISMFPAWNRYKFYRAGTVVRHNGELFKAKLNNIGQEPRTADFNNDFNGDYTHTNGSPIGSAGYWERYDAKSDWLHRLQVQAITGMVQRFVTEKSLLKESKALLERRTFFDGSGRLANTVRNGQRLVGFEIIPVRSMGVTAKIERIGLQMTGAVGKVRVYLFHSSQVEPMQVADLEFTKTNGGFQWFDVHDWFMPYISMANDSGGSWYLVYDQAALPEGMEAVNVTKDWSREPCGTCNVGSVEAWRELTKYLQISPFRVTSSTTFEQYPELWDIAGNVYTNTQNYGLNVEVSVMCDLSEFIIRERNIFATCLQKEMAARVIRMLAMNPNVRVNRNQSNASQFDLLYEVDGNPQGRETGLGKELKDAYAALDINTRGIDRICLTCRPVGVRYSHV